MPELPEVETIRKGLSKLLPSQVIKNTWHDWPKSFPNPPADVARFMIGSSVTAVRRRAKVLIIDLSTDYSLVIHLKMTGQLVFVGKPEKKNSEFRIENREVKTNSQPCLPAGRFPIPNSPPLGRLGGGHPNESLVANLPDRSTRILLDFTDGSKLFFNDQRKFGWMRLLPTNQIPEINFMKTVGPEPLESDFTADVFIDRLQRRKNSAIKAVLLDQTILAGVGNIYADESLYMAKIHPDSPVSNISKIKLVTLHKSIVDVLKLSIEKGGSTDRNYVNAEGKKGSYIEFAQVFRKEGTPCPRCGTEIIKIRSAGRGTHLCPNCQKLRKA